MKIFNSFLLLTSVLLITSCEDSSSIMSSGEEIFSSQYTFIACEGNYGSSNGSVFIIDKYIPQIYLNYTRKTTAGWNIYNVLLDFTGGFLSFVQEMLERDFLASTAFYAIYGHKSQHIDAYIEAVNEVFGVLSKALENEEVEIKLKGPVKHSGFQRLA